MKGIFTFAYFFLLLIISGSCVLPFELETIEYDRVIVVDGVVSTENKTHSIQLSYTSPIGSSEQPALQNAQVWVESSNGTEFNFIEASPGKYLSEVEFAANLDQDYQLFFRTLEGKLYQSDKNKPIPSPAIDSIYDRYVELIPVNTTIQDFGIQFFLDSHDETGTANFFRYEWEETYQVVTPYKSVFEYDYEANELINREVPINVCYQSDSSSSLIIGTTIGSTINQITELPIRFVTGKTDVLRNRYSINVKQYAINDNTYNYYQRIKDSERQGTLFDEQKGTVIGNISSSDGSDETVLGNFEVSGVSNLRVFFSITDLDENLITPSFRYRCVEEDKIVASINNARPYLDSNEYNIVELIPSETVLVVALAKEICSDCSGYASNEEPEFWIDD